MGVTPVEKKNFVAFFEVEFFLPKNIFKYCTKYSDCFEVLNKRKSLNWSSNTGSIIYVKITSKDSNKGLQCKHGIFIWSVLMIKRKMLKQLS